MRFVHKALERKIRPRVWSISGNCQAPTADDYRRTAASTLPLRALDRDVLERRRIGEAGDLAERGLAHSRADAVEESEFPNRRIDRFLVDQPLPLCEDRRPLLRVEFVGLQGEEFVDVG